MQNTRVKNLFSTILGVGVVAGGLVLSSCEDEFTEKDAIQAQQETLAALDKQDFDQEMDAQKYRDSLERIGPVVNYTVTVIAGGSANTNARTNGEAFADGATVTVVQGGSTFTATTSAGGVATFADLRIGDAVVTIEAADHTTVTYTTSMGNANYEVQEDNVETTIPVFPTTVAGGASEVSGIAWAELNTLNDEPEFAAGATVRATISVAGALSAYGVPFGSDDKGEIKSATYSDFIQTATVGDDGRYTLVIPNGNADGGDGISAKVEFLPFVAQQTYATMQGDSIAVVTRDVVFDPNVVGNDHIEDDIPSVYLEIAAPTGSAEGFELMAEVQPTPITVSDRRIDKRGSGYVVGDKFNFSADAEDAVAYIEVTAIDADGAITGFTTVNDGAEYTTKPSLTQDDAASGTGATFFIGFEANYEVKIVNEGSGYWDFPEVSVTYDEYDNGVLSKDAYSLCVSCDTDLLAGKVQDDDADGVIETVSSATVPTFTIVNPEATKAIVEMDDYFVDDDGKIYGDDDDEYLYPEVEGEGYMESPVVTFKSIGEGMGSGASAVAYINNGQVDYIVITNPGSGYKEDVNGKTYSVAATASSSSNKTFKPASSNTNYNFSYTSGVVKE